MRTDDNSIRPDFVLLVEPKGNTHCCFGRNRIGSRNITPAYADVRRERQDTVRSTCSGIGDYLSGDKASHSLRRSKLRARAYRKPAVLGFG